MTKATLAASELGSAEELEEVQKTWLREAADFWDMTAKKSERGKVSNSKVDRGSALRWIAATQHQLVTMTGEGWEKYIIPDKPEQRVNAPNWPTLTLCIDQGSDGWAAAAFLTNHMRCSVLVVPDPSHRTWNDVEGALRDADMWLFCMTFITVMSIDQGPWDGAKWWEQGKQAAQELQC